MTIKKNPLNHDPFAEPSIPRRFGFLFLILKNKVLNTWITISKLEVSQMTTIEADWVDEFLLECLFGENLEELE